MISKKIKTIYNKSLLIIGLLAIITSCTDVLELEPETTWAAEKFYKTESEINIALAGIYSSLSSGQTLGDRMLMMDYGTDEGYALKGWVEDTPTNLYTHNETTKEITDSWKTFYQGINNVNNFITYIDPNNFEEEEYNRFIGEARFLRGFFYYQLTIWWNEVPLRLTPTVDQNSNHKAPASLEEVYTQIITDLTFASEHLPSAFDGDYVPGHANSMAAHAILAKTYLKAAGHPLQASEINGKNPYQAAKDHCEIIMTDGNHVLNPNYKELFLNYIQNRFELSETLFEIVFKNGSDLGVGISGKLGYTNGLLYKPNPRINTPYSDPLINPSPIFELTYEEGDARKSWNVPGISGRGNGQISKLAGPLTWGYGIGKFRRWEPIYPDDIEASNLEDTPIVVLETPSPLSATSTGINLPIVRFADVLLMFAEATNELSGPTAEAIAAIDLVRNRAELESLATVKPQAIGGKNEFFLEIVDERLRELCFEGHRKSDLVRWGLLETKINELEESIIFNSDYDAKKHTAQLRCVRNFNPQKHLSLPYPQQEVLINNLLEQKTEW